jgi:hypothetical protein
MKLTFRTIGVDTIFRMNGNTYIKRSSRTAKLIGMSAALGDYCRTFYFGQKDVVEVYK